MLRKTILLTIPEPILKKLKIDKKKRGFSKLQELIIDIVRDNYFRKSKTGAKRGRPKHEIDEHKILRGEIKKGKKISEPWI
ncbi:MAG: hypothetical protein ABIG37_01090 [Nanoarchaeota archaeon]|nr:hypothetical protein [Nanoarchaeota archaeon]